MLFLRHVLRFSLSLVHHIVLESDGGAALRTSFLLADLIDSVKMGRSGLEVRFVAAITVVAIAVGL
jgi:hypothetical protein